MGGSHVPQMGEHIATMMIHFLWKINTTFLIRAELVVSLLVLFLAVSGSHLQSTFDCVCGASINSGIGILRNDQVVL